jgi:hypothetical protein
MSKLERNQKVFGLGLSRTGTSSLGEALNILSIRTIHFPHDQKTYEELVNSNYRLSILDEYQGIVDISVAPYYAQLDEVYPGSRFILTVREKKAWLTSAENQWRVIRPLMDRDHEFKRFADFISTAVYGSLTFHVGRYSYVYDTHVKNVCDYFRGRQSDLLIMDVAGGDGWEKLCEFLGFPVPQAAFPRAKVMPADPDRWVEQFS